jgi:hypothetical protein
VDMKIDLRHAPEPVGHCLFNLRGLDGMRK